MRLSAHVEWPTASFIRNTPRYTKASVQLIRNMFSDVVYAEYNAENVSSLSLSEKSYCQNIPSETGGYLSAIFLNLFQSLIANRKPTFWSQMKHFHEIHAY